MGLNLACEVVTSLRRKGVQNCYSYVFSGGSWTEGPEIGERGDGYLMTLLVVEVM